ncbi:DEKNAAC103750 [Brettanomyces naardenensis]|uniref:DEKNAAC103750 n=1 Tax=Brettanomyces naardenensis TaxID=13370 RepID=A0A448YP58_BRENA|nr:DEKNAAC103750 [Brettanomyces naardenensis]
MESPSNTPGHIDNPVSPSHSNDHKSPVSSSPPAQSTPKKKQGKPFEDISNPTASLLAEEREKEEGKPQQGPEDAALHEAVSNLLGVHLAQWPYNDESLRAMIELKTEQERVRAEEARARALEGALTLVNRAASLGVPPDLIPTLFSAPEEEIVRRIEVLKSSQPLPYEYTPSRAQQLRKQPYSDVRPQLGVLPEVQPSPTRGAVPSSSASGSAAPQYSSTTRSSRPIPTQQQQQQQQPHSAYSPSHQRSHTVGSTSVWKVNLPQQQQFQFHHWAGPSGNSGASGTSGTSGTSHTHSRSGSEFSTYSHSRAPSRDTARIREENELDTTADMSTISVSASPAMTTKRKLEDTAEQPVRQGHGRSISIDAPMPGQIHKRNRSETGVLPPPSMLGSPYLYHGQQQPKQGSPVRAGQYPPRAAYSGAFVPPQPNQPAAQSLLAPPPQLSPPQQGAYYYQPPPPPYYRQQQGYRFPPVSPIASIEERSQTGLSASGIRTGTPATSITGTPGRKPGQGRPNPENSPTQATPAPGDEPFRKSRR